MFLILVARAAIHFVSSADRSLDKRIAVPQSCLGGRALGRDKEKGMVILHSVHAQSSNCYQQLVEKSWYSALLINNILDSLASSFRGQVVTRKLLCFLQTVFFGKFHGTRGLENVTFKSLNLAVRMHAVAIVISHCIEVLWWPLIFNRIRIRGFWVFSWSPKSIKGLETQRISCPNGKGTGLCK